VAWWQLPGLWRVITLIWMTLIPLTLLLLLIALYPDKVERAIKSDVRLPLWGRTTALIIDHDWTTRNLWALAHSQWSPAALGGDVSGVGAGNFQRTFTVYRANSHYHDRKVAAPKTIHPHNEALNVGAQLGWWPMLAWLALCLVAVTAVFVGNQMAHRLPFALIRRRLFCSGPRTFRTATSSSGLPTRRDRPAPFWRQRTPHNRPTPGPHWEPPLRSWRDNTNTPTRKR